jgi:hypothetical protein
MEKNQIVALTQTKPSLMVLLSKEVSLVAKPQKRQKTCSLLMLLPSPLVLRLSAVSWPRSFQEEQLSQPRSLRHLPRIRTNKLL